MVANTLGTAAGDFISDTLRFGFFISSIVIACLLIIIALLHFYTRISSLLLFWLAFVLTRPFGATFGDLLTKSTEKGGLNLGTVGASIVFIILLIFALIKETRVEKIRNRSYKHF